jgi:hypothetical protein
MAIIPQIKQNKDSNKKKPIEALEALRIDKKNYNKSIGKKIPMVDKLKQKLFINK